MMRFRKTCRAIGLTAIVSGAIVSFSTPSGAQETYSGDAKRLTDLLKDKAAVVGFTGNTILLQQGTSLFRCEIGEILERGNKLKGTDGTSLFRYRSRGCGKIEE